MDPSLHSTGIYATLLGASWPGLHETVRRFHVVPGVIRAEGVFRVRRGTNWVTRLMATIARMPAETEAVDIVLVVSPKDGGEEWRRSFAGRPLVSWQTGRADGLMAERMGLFELRFRLRVEGDALAYETARVALCLGPLRLPLPRWLSPSGTALEKAVGDGQLAVSVEVRLPLLGRLVAYDGTLTRIEAQG